MAHRDHFINEFYTPRSQRKKNSSAHSKLKKALCDALIQCDISKLDESISIYTLSKWAEALFEKDQKNKILLQVLYEVAQKGADNIPPNPNKANYFSAKSRELNDAKHINSSTSTFYFAMAFLNDCRLMLSRLSSVAKELYPVINVIPPECFFIGAFVLYPLRLLIDFSIVLYNTLLPKGELQKNLSHWRRFKSNMTKDSRFSRMLSNGAWFTDFCLSYTVLSTAMAMHLSIVIAVAFLIYTIADDYHDIQRYQKMKNAATAYHVKSIAQEKIEKIKSRCATSATLAVGMIAGFVLSLFPPTALLGVIVALVFGIISSGVRVKRFHTSRLTLFDDNKGMNRSSIYQDQYSLDPGVAFETVGVL